MQLIATLALMALFMPSALAQTEPTPPRADNDQCCAVAGEVQFMLDAALRSRFIYELATLAKDRADRSENKATADILIQDHAEFLRELEIASLANTVPPALMQEQADALAGLAALEGAAFTTHFLAVGIGAYRELIDVLEPYAREGEDPTLRRFAETNISMARENLALLERLGSAG